MLMASTVELETTAPDESVTFPTRSPLVACPNDSVLNTTIRANSRIPHPPKVCFCRIFSSSLCWYCLPLYWHVHSQTSPRGHACDEPQIDATRNQKNGKKRN